MLAASGISNYAGAIMSHRPWLDRLVIGLAWVGLMCTGVMCVALAWACMGARP